ncbi:hypothetical protein FHP05_12105 [Cerasibacillus terrae]|uniref:DUF1310 family protein n=1 Tax=Cerasibacillus terrae TaxID=2498845 RepID=A0A5C8NMQ8_9BACI|nr:hypothetical protein [Cerasibacillus terrae]TXL62542.1 hypothetical protein FHP05_12105 [Cerasibacillus terrae]
MKKKWVFLVIGLLLIIGIGGKIFMDQKEAEKEVEKIEAERMSVEALKNTFADIKSVEFEKSGYNVMTGSYRMFVKMTNQEGKSVRFSYSYEKSTPYETGGYMLKDEEVQIEGITTNKVQVIYSNKVEGEV